MTIIVFRLGHRFVRDDRVTTHIFLTSRAFGAEKAVYSGQRDPKMEAQLREIVAKWGGGFSVEYTCDEAKRLKTWKREGKEIVHLTMYGLPVQDVIDEVRASPRDKVVIVGGAKVPRPIFTDADWNIAVTSQPHSEVSALSVFLHELFQGTELGRPFENARIRVIPQTHGKKVVTVDCGKGCQGVVNG